MKRKFALLLLVVALCLAGALLIVPQRTRNSQPRFAEKFKPLPPSTDLRSLRFSPTSKHIVGGTSWSWMRTSKTTGPSLGGNSRGILEEDQTGVKYHLATVVVWDTESGQIVRSLGLFDADVDWVDFSGNGEVYAGVAEETGQIKAWRTSDGTNLLDEQVEHLGGSFAAPAVALSPNGDLLAVGRGTEPVEGAVHEWFDECEIVIYSLTGEKRRAFIVEGHLKSIEFFHGTQYLAVLRNYSPPDEPSRIIYGSQLDIYELASAKKIDSIELPHIGDPRLESRPGSAQLLVLDMNELSVYDATTSSIVAKHTLPARDTGVNAHRMSSDGIHFARHTWTGIDVVNLDTGAIESFDVESDIQNSDLNDALNTLVHEVPTPTGVRFNPPGDAPMTTRFR